MFVVIVVAATLAVVASSPLAAKPALVVLVVSGAYGIAIAIDRALETRRMRRSIGMLVTAIFLAGMKKRATRIHVREHDDEHIAVWLERGGKQFLDTWQD